MAVYQTLLLNTVVPQIQAAQAGDSYVMVVNATTPALRITQTGTGNALEVEDSSNPDATPFVVSAAGDVGIGTNTPGAKLDVVGNINVKQFVSAGSGSTDAYLGYSWNRNLATGALFDNAKYAYNTIMQPGINNLVTEIYSPGGSVFSANAIVLTSSGNLGLGVTPSAWGSGYKALQVGYAALSNPSATYDSLSLTANLFYDGTNWKFIETQQANRLSTVDGVWTWEYATGSAGATAALSTQMTLNASGNLGVGTTSVNPTGLAILSGGQGKGVLVARNATGSPTSGQSLGSYAFKGIMDGVNSNAAAEAMIEAVAAENQSGSTAATNLLFYTKPSGTGPGSSPTERARITSGGYFKASNNGTYTNATGPYHEFYQTANNEALVVRNTNNSQTSDTLFVQSERNTTNNSFYAINYYNGGAAAYKFRVADSGDVTNTNGTYGTISDQKMKTDIVDAGSQWSDIKALRFRKFKMKDDPSGLVQLGVVAQEVELTSPGLVDEHQDRDAEGNDLGTTTKSVKTSVLLMKAAVALQEAMARIETLEAKIAALEAK